MSSTQVDFKTDFSNLFCVNIFEKTKNLDKNKTEDSLSTDCSPLGASPRGGYFSCNLLKEVELSNFFVMEFQKNFKSKSNLMKDHFSDTSGTKLFQLTSVLKGNWSNKVQTFKESRKRKLLSKINFMNNTKINFFDLKIWEFPCTPSCNGNSNDSFNAKQKSKIILTNSEAVQGVKKNKYTTNNKKTTSNSNINTFNKNFKKKLFVSNKGKGN